MIKIIDKILKSIVKQIEVSTQNAAGATSHWTIYQPKEPDTVKNLKK